jgi:hypothetical protein
MEKMEFLARVLTIGVGATILMDLWALLLRQFGVPSLNFALLGRWIGHLPKGQWRHQSIAKAAPVKGELLMGWGSALLDRDQLRRRPRCVVRPAMGSFAVAVARARRRDRNGHPRPCSSSSRP